jgi:hypothetical protein
MMHMDWFGKQVEDTINRAKNGDTYAAKKLMQWYCGGLTTTIRKKGVSQTVNREPSIDERILRYFGECFGKVLEIEETTQTKKGEKAMAAYDALHLKKHTVQADPNRKGKEMDIANEVTALLEFEVPKIDAFGLVAGKYYPEYQENYSLGSSTPVVCLAGRFYPDGGAENDKGFKATREAYYHYNIKSQAKRITKQLQQEQDQQ